MVALLTDSLISTQDLLKLCQSILRVLGHVLGFARGLLSWAWEQAPGSALVIPNVFYLKVLVAAVYFTKLNCLVLLHFQRIYNINTALQNM